MKKNKEIINVSIIVPFYDGNIFLPRLFLSIDSVVAKFAHMANFEVLIINDSPQIPVEIPKCGFEAKVINNAQNSGIQKSRINGLKKATGEWIIFLDQDDELVCDGFQRQIELTSQADVVVGNGIYMLGETEKLIYSNGAVMSYLIQKENFLKIRNLIPSPGECLIRKEAIPVSWTENYLENNGADDWMLWILLFFKSAKYNCNDEIVYIHNDTDGGNLSSNLSKMKESCLEMIRVLSKKKLISEGEVKKLYRAVNFKFLQDTKKLNMCFLIRYADVVLHNIIYKIKIALLYRKSCPVR